VSTFASHSPDTVELVSMQIADLVRERQDLRVRGADAGLLERNRRRIVDLQREFSRALIERYHPQAVTA
jgi:hypothetical protein